MMQQNVDEIIVSFDGVKIKHFRAYWLAVAKGNWLEQDKFFSKVVKRWQWKLDPSDPNSYGELEVLQYKEVQNAIQTASSSMLLDMSSQSIKEKE